MPNLNTPRGFKPVGDASEGPVTYGISTMKIASGYATNIFSGDVVKLLTTGYINLAAASDQIRGVLVGVKYVDSTGTPQARAYWPASTTTLGAQDVEALVITSPAMVFEAQFGNATTAPTTALIGATFASYTDAAGGSTASGISAMGIDITTVNTTAQQWRFLGFVPRPDNDVASAYARGRFTPALHDLRVNTGI